MTEGTSIKRILIFEDDRDYRNLLKTYIGKYLPGVDLHEYDPVSRGAPREDFDWSQYDVLILDYYLCIYGLTGLDLLQKHRKKPGFPATIMLTGAGNEEVAVRALNFGVYDYLRKENLSREQLIESINTAFHKHNEELIKQREQERVNKAFDKALFYRLLEHPAEAVSGDGPLALLLVDVDDIDRLASEYGLIMRDNLLRHIARQTYEKLKISCNPFITRLGDASTGVLLDCSGPGGSLENVMQQLWAHFDANPYLLADKPVSFTVSIGAVIIDQEGSTVSSLIERANQLRDIARQTPGNSCHISLLTEILETENRRRLEAEQERKAEEEAEQQRKAEEDRLRREEEKRREEERLRIEEEKRKAAEAEHLRQEEEKQLRQEEQRRKEVELQLRREAEKRKALEEAEQKRKQQEEEQRHKAEEAERKKIRLQEELERKQEEERLRQEAAAREKAENDRRLEEEQQRKDAEARQKAEAEKLRIAEQERLRQEEEKRRAAEAAVQEKQRLEEETARQKAAQASSDEIVIDESTLDENSLVLKKAFNENRVIQTFQPAIAMFTPETGNAPAMFKVEIEMIDEQGNIKATVDIDRHNTALNLQQFTDRWILREIIGRIVNSEEFRKDKIYLITISEAWLADVTLFTWLKKLLTGFENIRPGKSIALELPAKMLGTHKKRALALIKALKQSHGFEIAIGEVETADELKSLSGLKDLDLLTVKWNLLDELRKNPETSSDIAIMSALKSQGTHIIFDGIEDATMLTEAISLGTDYVMGSFIGEPQSNLAGAGNVETFDISY